MYMIAVQGWVTGWGGGGGEKPFMYNVLDTKGEGCGRGFSHGGDFMENWVLNTGFLCIIKILI